MWTLAGPSADTERTVDWPVVTQLEIYMKLLLVTNTGRNYYLLLSRPGEMSTTDLSGPSGPSNYSL